MDIDELIARRLTALRKERGLTLAQLAERYAVNKTMIPRIGRNQNSPTASVLDRLAGGLGVALSELLSDAQTPAKPLCRHAQQEVWGDPASGYRRRQIGTRDPRNGYEVVGVEIPTNVRFDYPHWSGRPYRQHLQPVEGTLRVDYSERTFHLQHGDRLDFDVGHAVTFTAAGQAYRYLLVVLHD